MTTTTVGTKVKKKRRLSLRAKKSLIGLLFVSPFIIGFIAFYVRGLFMTISFSVSNAKSSRVVDCSIRWIRKLSLALSPTKG